MSASQSLARSPARMHIQGLATQQSSTPVVSEWWPTLANDALEPDLLMPLKPLPTPWMRKRRTRTLSLWKLAGALQLPPPNILPQSRMQALLGTDPPPRVEPPHHIHRTDAVWAHGRATREQLREKRLEVALEGVELSTTAVTSIAAGARLVLSSPFHRSPLLKDFKEETARAAIVHVLGDAGVSCVFEYEIAGFLRNPKRWSTYGNIDIYVPSAGANRCAASPLDCQAPCHHACFGCHGPDIREWFMPSCRVPARQGPCH